MDVMEPDVSTPAVKAMMELADEVRAPVPEQELSPPTAPPAEGEADPGGDTFASLIQKISALSVAELERMIDELQEARSYLQAEGERIEREAIGYAALSQTALESVRIISDTVSEWRKAGHPVRGLNAAD
jgi:hypothetical protein